ncbi:unnamed protein product [Calypogeia fissa]
MAVGVWHEVTCGWCTIDGIPGGRFTQNKQLALLAVCGVHVSQCHLLREWAAVHEGKVSEYPRLANHAIQFAMQTTGDGIGHIHTKD